MLYDRKMNIYLPKQRAVPVFGLLAAAFLAGVLVETALSGGSAPASAPQQHRQVGRTFVPPTPPKPYEFPAGGRTLAGKYRLAALYGTPDSPLLGALGDQPMDASVVRVKGIAAAYQQLSPEPVYPAFEIIATVASATPTDNGDYSRETDPAAVLAWAKAADKAGVYVILDIQPGRRDFLSQAKLYEAALQLPNVGLALDPEWRLGPTQVHLQQIGSASSAEINDVSAWLAALVRDHNLPQKAFVLHQFRLTMLPDRQQIDTSHPELAYIIQMDGQGGQPAKLDTWRAVTTDPPTNAAFGWKNFYHQDVPMLDPAGTMSLSPKPWYISYQ
jgi:hypothetical protein